MPNLFLENKVALITGGSRGIGLAIALELAGHGADVVINYLRKTSSAQAVVAEVEAMGRRALAVKANLAEAENITAMFSQIEAEFGRCDILIGNAASGVPRPILDVEDKHWDWTMDINARSILRCAKLAAPYMKAQGWGRIISLSSQGSTRVIPHYGVTGLSKAVIESLTRYLAVELAPHGISVNAVSPGIVNTDALKHFPIDVSATLQEASQQTPAGRTVSPEEVAALVAFLCRPEAEMIVGQTIEMDGGLGLLF